MSTWCRSDKGQLVEKAASYTPSTPSVPPPPTETHPCRPLLGSHSLESPLNSLPEAPRAHGPRVPEVPKAHPPGILFLHPHRSPTGLGSQEAVRSSTGRVRLHCRCPRAPGHLRLHHAPHHQLRPVASESRATSNRHRQPCSPSTLPLCPAPLLSSAPPCAPQHFSLCW